jgi:anti-anti-sigma factor
MTGCGRFRKGVVNMEVTLKTDGTVAVVAVSGRLDTVTVSDFDGKWGELVTPDMNKVVIDLGSLEYISSAGLRSILVAGKQMKSRGGALAVSGLTGMVADVFSISGFDKLLPLYGNTDEAVSALKS